MHDKLAQLSALELQIQEIRQHIKKAEESQNRCKAELRTLATAFRTSFNASLLANPGDSDNALRSSTRTEAILDWYKASQIDGKLPIDPKWDAITFDYLNAVFRQPGTQQILEQQQVPSSGLVPSPLQFAHLTMTSLATQGSGVTIHSGYADVRSDQTHTAFDYNVALPRRFRGAAMAPP